MTAELEAVHDAELVAAETSALPAVVDINATLTPEAAEDLANSGRENTRQTYEDRWKAFARWCAPLGRMPGPPTSEENLTSYISHLRRRDLQPGVLRLSVAAIRHMNARAGYEQHPDQAAALKIYQDHRHAWQKAGRGQNSSAPVDLQRLRLMLAACPAETPAGKRDRVLLLLGYYMRARASELSQLRVGDLEFVSSELLVATKRVSKNDKTDVGREYEIDDPACLAAVKDWLVHLAENGQTGRGLPLLRAVDRWGNLGSVSPQGWGVTRQAVNNLVKSIAERAEVDVAADITAHGLRAGVPTDLGAAGYSAAEIKEITGDWSSTEQVEKYRKVGLRRAGKRTDDGRRSAALSMLRVQGRDADNPAAP
ncbi:tyrosine-type recombinase/integrase [Streptomyces sp. SID8374]|uniref:tyrosine-type recombinase/integrase n=1 Tax=Streptomyces sp. SID8374 TaxID=2690354 RepID=UPI001371BA98|nr:tyrosine-type recombinase/integrase [Streptomyces sp. SID8374]